MWIAISAVLVAFVCAFLWLGNNWLSVSKYEIKNKKVPENFNGYKIVQISDLHNKRFGVGQKNLIKEIKKQTPDVIFVTGDLVDRRRLDIQIAMEFIKKAVEISPVFYVCGNHEACFGIYEKLRPILQKAGVTVLDNSTVELAKNGEKITVTGFPDPWARGDFYEHAKDYNSENLIKYCNSLSKTNFNILLCHRPELLEAYSKAKVDLAFSGHAHGGQFRVPFLGVGIFSPHQGFLPKKAMGTCILDSTTLVVSRGLGNSRFPFRIFNRPEIVTVELKSVA